MTYTDSLWRNAPEGATHWGIYYGHEFWLKMGKDNKFVVWQPSHEWGSFKPDPADFTNIHPRPQIYKTPEQLVSEYREEHGAKVESDCDGFLSFNPSLSIDHLIDNATFHLSLLEKYLEIQRNKDHE